jgi:predicted enzyme related to lactoylglutathione lyase
MKDPFKTHGKFSWCELMTNDVAAAKQFYAELLGWGMNDMPMEGLTYTVLKEGDEEVGGIMAKPPEAAQAPPYWGCYVTVDNVDAVAKKAEALGAKTIVPPTDIPEVGRFYVFQDPQGAVLSLITYVEKK